MKCPIINNRTKYCDAEYTPDEFRSHFVYDHDTLSLQISILFMLAQLLEGEKK